MTERAVPPINMITTAMASVKMTVANPPVNKNQLYNLIALITIYDNPHRLTDKFWLTEIENIKANQKKNTIGDNFALSFI